MRTKEELLAEMNRRMKAERYPGMYNDAYLEKSVEIMFEIAAEGIASAIQIAASGECIDPTHTMLTAIYPHGPKREGRAVCATCLRPKS